MGEQLGPVHVQSCGQFVQAKNWRTHSGLNSPKRPGSSTNVWCPLLVTMTPPGAVLTADELDSAGRLARIGDVGGVADLSGYAVFTPDRADLRRHQVFLTYVASVMVFIALSLSLV